MGLIVRWLSRAVHVIVAAAGVVDRIAPKVGAGLETAEQLSSFTARELAALAGELAKDAVHISQRLQQLEQDEAHDDEVVESIVARLDAHDARFTALVDRIAQLERGAP